MQNVRWLSSQHFSWGKVDCIFNRESIVNVKINFHKWFICHRNFSDGRCQVPYVPEHLIKTPWQEIKRGEVRSRRLIYEESDETRANGATHLPACQLLAAGVRKLSVRSPLPFVISRLTLPDTAGGGESKTISLWKITTSIMWNFRTSLALLHEIYILCPEFNFTVR